jgi:hypothetical protein
MSPSEFETWIELNKHLAIMPDEGAVSVLRVTELFHEMIGRNIRLFLLLRRHRAVLLQQIEEGEYPLQDIALLRRLLADTDEVLKKPDIGRIYES